MNIIKKKRKKTKKKTKKKLNYLRNIENVSFTVSNKHFFLLFYILIKPVMEIVYI